MTSNEEHKSEAYLVLLKQLNLKLSCVSFTRWIFSNVKDKNNYDESKKEFQFKQMDKFKDDLLALVNLIEE